MKAKGAIQGFGCDASTASVAADVLAFVEKTRAIVVSDGKPQWPVFYGSLLSVSDAVHNPGTKTDGPS
jgi:hypothetical protein